MCDHRAESCCDARIQRIESVCDPRPFAAVRRLIRAACAARWPSLTPMRRLAVRKATLHAGMMRKATLHAGMMRKATLLTGGMGKAMMLAGVVCGGLAMMPPVPVVAQPLDPTPQPMVVLRQTAIEQPMWQDPALPDRWPVQFTFADRTAELWLQALQRNDPELTRQVARAIVSARDQGVDADVFEPHRVLLARKLADLSRQMDEQADRSIMDMQQRYLKIELVRVLAVLDHRDAAPLMLKVLDPTDLELATLIDLALSRWKYRPAISNLRDRLANRSLDPLVRASAARRLGQLIIGIDQTTTRDSQESQESQEMTGGGGPKDVQSARDGAAQDAGGSGSGSADAGDVDDSIDLLTRIAADADEPHRVRIDAAFAAGRLDPRGLVEPARTLAEDRTSLTSRLVAVNLLHAHQSDQAVAVLKALAADPSAAVAHSAAGHLIRVAPDQALPRVAPWIRQGDRGLGLRAVEALKRQQAESVQLERVSLLAQLWGHEHPRVRAASFELSVTYGTSEHESVRQAVKQLAVRNLRPFHHAGSRSASAWRRQELACYVAGKLDATEAGPQLLAHLNHPRHEVRMAAATALRWIDDPALLPEALEAARRLDQQINEQIPVRAQPEDASSRMIAPADQIAQLFQWFGVRQYQPAGALLRKYVPKSQIASQSRAAAIWALGWLEQDKADHRLANQLAGRLRDVESMMPEFEDVRYMAAIAIGRIGSDRALPSLNQFAGTDNLYRDRTALACRWTIERITGKTLAEPEPNAREISGFFLEAVDD